jgi:transglutaminase superfamily protein
LTQTRYVLLAIQAWWELARYDLMHAMSGFRQMYLRVERQPVADHGRERPAPSQVCDAVTLAACFYWKRVYCLQRSAVAAMLLRKSGIDGRLVIGYRPSPFFSHAWVEVNGRVVNDSPTYKDRMHVLCTF